MQSFNPEYRGKDYLDQYHRLERWFEKVQAVKSNRLQLEGVSIDEQEDYFYVFFLLVINLRDWLEKSGDSEVKNIFFGSGSIQCLKICCDFTNNFKHFDNSRNPQIDEETYFISRSAIARLGLSKEQLIDAGPIHTWFVKSKNLEIDAYELAEDCFEVMKRYMKEKGYI